MGENDVRREWAWRVFGAALIGMLGWVLMAVIVIGERHPDPEWWRFLLIVGAVGVPLAVLGTGVTFAFAEAEDRRINRLRYETNRMFRQCMECGVHGTYWHPDYEMFCRENGVLKLSTGTFMCRACVVKELNKLTQPGWKVHAEDFEVAESESGPEPEPEPVDDGPEEWWEGVLE